jgi:hypothetical protein
MATMTYYVALAFQRSEENGDIVASDPKEARSADHAIRMAGSLAFHYGLSSRPLAGFGDRGTLMRLPRVVAAGPSSWPNSPFVVRGLQTPTGSLFRRPGRFIARPHHP